RPPSLPTCFFFIAPPAPETYTLSLHDALPIYQLAELLERDDDLKEVFLALAVDDVRAACDLLRPTSIDTRPSTRPLRSQDGRRRSEEHTSELQSRSDLVCRLLLEKKNKYKTIH